MNVTETGKAISYLRKKAGLTQGQLAELLCISDKAVSKWERGLSCPDISLLPKIAILLDTDIESLLYGHHFQHKNQWCGMLLLDDNIEIDPLIFVYDKPLIYFLLSIFLLVGIKEILIKGKKCRDVKDALGDGSQWGIQIRYNISLENFVGNRSVAILNGYTVLYGLDLTKSCQRAMAEQNGSSILAIHSGKKNEGGIYMDYSRKVINDIADNTLQEHYYAVPFLFCKADNWQLIKKCEIFHEMIAKLQQSGMLYAEIIGRGMFRFDIHNYNSALELSNFVSLVQKQQGEQIACLEEISWRRGLIRKEQLINCGKKIIETGHKEYGEYIISLS